MGYCTKCGKTLNDLQFYTSKRLDKYPPAGKLDVCKKCLTMHVDNWEPSTYLWILEEIDVPYLEEEWNKILERYKDKPEKLTGTTILGRYLALMKLVQFKDKTYADTEKLREELEVAKVEALKAKGWTDAQIQQELSIDRTPEKPAAIQTAAETPEYYDPELEQSEVLDSLTEEDKIMLSLKWGRGYTWDEKVRMEQLYQDMMASYDIQGAGHKDTLVMLCKTSLKANQLIDSGDIDGFQKMQKAYDSLMKSGKFNLWTMKNFSSNHWGLIFIIKLTGKPKRKNAW